jgi:DNA-binding MarR family transcriptional regulator
MSTPTWLTDAEQAAWRGYLAMTARLTARLAREIQADFGISLSDFDVLVPLSEHPEGRMRVLKLAEAVQWEKSRLSHHLARMQRRGLVDRQDCPGDARGAFVLLTEQGRTAVEEAAPAHVAAVRTLLFDQLDPGQVDAFRAITDDVLGGPLGAGPTPGRD